MKITTLAVIAIIATSHFSIVAQTAASVPNQKLISIGLTMEKQQIPLGQSPVAILRVENLTREVIPIHGEMYRVYVEGEKGEAPTTLVQRQITGRLKPGEVPLRADEMVVWTIEPEKSGVRKIQLAYLYDLSAAGKYSVYAEVVNPSSKKWLRTNTVQFEIQAASQ